VATLPKEAHVAYACKFCLAQHGLNGTEIFKLPLDRETVAEHIEREHHYPVRRDGESQDEAEHRVFMTYLQPLWRAATAIEEALGGPNDAAAQQIEHSGPILKVNTASELLSALNLIRDLP
jgi:hypothetical protein